MVFTKIDINKKFKNIYKNNIYVINVKQVIEIQYFQHYTNVL